MNFQGRAKAIGALGIAQTLAWGSSYYLPAVLAGPMSKDLGVAPSTVFAAFSVALLASAALGPIAGRSIDRWGGRQVLMAANVVFALGLTLMGCAQGPWGLFAAWLVIGVAMGSGLYEAAFAALVRLDGKDSRGAITGVTLFAGFASTVGWPLHSRRDRCSARPDFVRTTCTSRSTRSSHWSMWLILQPHLSWARSGATKWWVSAYS